MVRWSGTRVSCVLHAAGQHFVEGFVAHRARVFLVVDHEARSRVDLPAVLVGLLLLQDPAPEIIVRNRLVEGTPAQAGECRQLPDLVSRVDTAREGPAILVGQQRTDERVILGRRQLARDHAGGQRHLVQREVVKTNRTFPGAIRSFSTSGIVAGEGGTMVQVNEKNSRTVTLAANAGVAPPCAGLWCCRCGSRRLRRRRAPARSELHLRRDSRSGRRRRHRRRASRWNGGSASWGPRSAGDGSIARPSGPARRATRLLAGRSP